MSFKDQCNTTTLSQLVSLQRDISAPPHSESSTTTHDLPRIGFMDLPIELRLEIWKFILPLPRKKRICFKEPGFIHVSFPVPTGLQVSHESRLETMKLVGAIASGESSLQTPLVRYYFSTKDIVVIDKSSLGNISFSFFLWYLRDLLKDEGMSQIRKLAIENTVWDGIHHLGAKPPNWNSMLLRLDHFIVFWEEATEPEIQHEDLEFFEAPNETAPYEIIRTQVEHVFRELYPNSGSSSENSQLPTISMMVAKRPLTPQRHRMLLESTRPELLEAFQNISLEPSTEPSGSLI